MNKLRLLLLFFYILISSSLMSQVFNPDLPFIQGKPSSWSGNPTIKGRFFHPQYPMNKSFSDVMKWKKMKNPYELEKKNDTFQLPISQDLNALKSDSTDGIFWLGHATFVIRINGIQFITDPVFGKATVLKRFSKLPVQVEELPQSHYLLMSHDHRDHCDKRSLKLLKKLNPNLKFYSGLNMDKILKQFLKGSEGQVAGWYQKYQTDSFELYFLPTRHWAKRGFFDTNKRLWGSFILKIGGKTIYFGGDSGYSSHYKEIAELFPDIDYAILGIGAFEPEWFMETNHASPEKAYQEIKDLNAQYMIPMHYGTFDLSDEPVCYPQKMLETIKESRKDSSIIIPNLGGNLIVH